MLASPVPIYFGCAALIVGSLGLGAHHMLGGTSGSTSESVTQQPPLFAQSVEEALLPSPQWPSSNPGVAYYGPMVELLQTTRSAEHQASTSARATEETRTAPREVVRDLSSQQTKQSRRAKKSRNRDDMRERDIDSAAAVDAVDPREARAQAEPGRATRRSDRRRPEVEERRQREGEPRDQHYFRGEQRDVGFSPFRLFGGFDQR